MLSHADTVSALTYSIIREECTPELDDGLFPHNRVTRFVLEQQGRMPDYLRRPMVLLTLAFDAAAIPRSGRPFHALDHQRRWRQITAWKHSALGFRRDLIKFYESLVIFAWYGEIHGSGHE